MNARRPRVTCAGPAMAAALALGLAAAAPAPACTDASLAAQEDLAAHPDHTDSRDAIARDCARAGRHAEALAHYDILLLVNMDNADWLLGRAQALVALDRPREALPVLERARRVAPGYEDVWRLNATAFERSGDDAATDSYLVEAERALPQASWPAKRRAALRRQRLLEHGTRASLAASYEELSGGRPAWQALTLDLSHPLDAQRRVHGGLNFEERFEQRDEQASAGYSQRLNDDWSYGVSGDYTIDAAILPDWSFTAEIGRALPGGRSLGLRARHAAYEMVNVDLIAASFEQYLKAFRIAYALTAAQPSDLDWSFGHALRVAHDYDDASHVTLALGYGEEAETIAPGVVQVTRNKSVSVNGVHWRSAAWGFAWEAGWYRQGDLYDRVRIRLGLEHRF